MSWAFTLLLNKLIMYSTRCGCKLVSISSISRVYTHIFSIVITPTYLVYNHYRITDRPTPDVSSGHLSAIEIKPLILSIYDSIRNFSSLPILENLSSPHYSYTCLRCRTTLNCLTESNCLTCRTIHTYFAHDNWSMCD